MPLYTVFLLAVALSMDAFAVAVATGCAVRAPRLSHYARLAACFGVFQFLMPVLGWALGLSVRGYMEAWDHWIAFGLLVWVGGNMLRSGLAALKHRETSCPATDPTAGRNLLILGVATSIDALAVGVSLTCMEVDILAAAGVIGAVAFCLSVLGGLLGRRLGCLFQRRAELAGGIVLILIGVRILIEHLTGG